MKPLLYHEIVQGYPHAMQAALHARFERQARSNLINTTVITKVLAPLERRGISTVPLKGPALAAWPTAILLSVFSQILTCSSDGRPFRAPGICCSVWFSDEVRALVGEA